jgi:hypothetical protein
MCQRRTGAVVGDHTAMLSAPRLFVVETEPTPPTIQASRADFLKSIKGTNRQIKASHRPCGCWHACRG